MKRLSILLTAAAVLILAGCPATVPTHGQMDETEYFPDGSVKKKTTASSDYALYIAANKAAAPVAKVSLPAPDGKSYSIEIPMVAGQTQAIAPPAVEQSAADKWIDRGFRFGEILLRGYGISRAADVAIEATHSQRDQAIANTQGYVAMGGAIQGTANAGFMALGNVPRVSSVNVSGNALIGDGAFNLNSQNTNRTCTGGQAAAGGNGGGTTTGAPGAAGGSGGSANC